jgi:hypothetical protein
MPAEKPEQGGSRRAKLRARSASAVGYAALRVKRNPSAADVLDAETERPDIRYDRCGRFREAGVAQDVAAVRRESEGTVVPRLAMFTTPVSETTMGR